MYIRSPQELALLVISQRKKLNLTQAEVADRVGLLQKTISAFENNPEGSKMDTVFMILAGVGLDINALPKNAPVAKADRWNKEW